MRLKSNFLSIIIAFVFIQNFLFLSAQSPVEFSGYLSEMPSYSWQKESGITLFDNLVHNRINLAYSPNDKLRMKMEFRNRIFWGETVSSTPLYKHIIGNDPGWMDLSFNWGSGKSYLVNTTIDRLSLEYVAGNFQVQVGRQRVNWSQTMVWNPNDIFNSYSYFDFDYVERPGMDGVRLQYFTGLSSQFETVLKVDVDNRLSTAALYRFNTKGYDIQLIAGQVNQEDYILGGGWSGNISGAGFYGEVSYLSSVSNKNDNILITSVGGNYTFKNSLMLTGEYLYSSNLKDYEGGFAALIYGQASIKTLSITEHSYMLSGAYPVSPLLSLSVAYMGFGFPVFNSFYVGPIIDYSISDNLYISGIFQIFSGEIDQQKELSALSFVRLKWSF
ncbi:hypothetical protein E9993_14035 [Labilibacter sediminis]|nr:hypothetical protein E9993_14035 [Labilibacter sediminis]